MPQLPSGVQFAIQGILREDRSHPNFSAFCEHVIASAERPSELYGLLEVIRFGTENEAAGHPRVDFKIPGVPDIAYRSGMSFLSFLRDLSDIDQEEAIGWINQGKQQRWIVEMVLELRRALKLAGIPPLFRHRPGLVLKPLEVHQPDDLAINCDGFFGSCTDEWKSYQSDAGFLRVRPTMILAVTGIQGALALGNPPSPVDFDAWDASKPAGVWDFWEFLRFTTAPSSDGGMDLVFYFGENTFFERPYEVVKTIAWSHEDASEGILDSVDYSGVVERWSYFLKIFQEHGFLGDLTAQRWTRGEEVYDSSYPCE